MIIEMTIGDVRLVISGDNLSVKTEIAAAAITDTTGKPGILAGELKSICGISPDEIREIRRSLGMGQKEFANLFPTGQSSVSRWENGVDSPSGAAVATLFALKGRTHPHQP